MVGKILGNRYEIIEKIGTGGMSDVYKARCRKLNRFVAIKILKQEFADNEGFIKSFKVEAQAAASLSHPNIVSVYDVGNHNELNYIVMEYIEGITLKEYILKNGKLDWKEAVQIAIQISSALEVAHKNGIVHRDVKPHNIIITSDGIAKVTDFGIAKAASYFTVTFAGDAIGSVHYFSPEQARGGFTDNKSDIYSLGVVLYEMLTGTLPFDGDTPVAIAYKHIEQKPVAPNLINEDIPVSLNNIVLKAMAKNSDKRFSTATELIEDLNNVLKNPNEKVDDYKENLSKYDSPTIIIPAVISKNEEKVKGNLEVKMKDKKTKPKSKKKNSKFGLIVAMISALMIVVTITFFGYRFVFDVQHTAPEVAVPNLIGKTEEEARRVLSKSNLTLKILDKRSNETVPAGQIFEQYPEVGLIVKIPDEVEVVVSSGTKEVEIPDIDKTDYREAKLQLENMGLVPKISYESSEEIPINFVINTNPIVGSVVEKGEEVELVVSKGPEEETISMPNLIGLSEYQARKTLEENNLKLNDNISYEENSKPYGTVIKQSIDENTEVSAGTDISLVLSTGKIENLGKQVQLDISLPTDRETVEVEVVYINDKGNRSIVFPKTVRKTSESPLTIKVTGQGKGRIQVYFDGILSSEDNINFEGDE